MSPIPATVFAPSHETVPHGLLLGSEALDLLPTAAYICNADGQIIGYNERAAELWGERPVPGASQPLYCGSYRLHWPDGSALPHEHCPMATAVCTGIAIRNAEVVIERRDGSRRIGLVNIQPIRDAEGRVTGAINSIVDITERKMLAARVDQQRRDLEDFFENGAVALHWVDGNGVIIRANQTELDMMGYARDEYVGRPIAEFHVDRTAICDILDRLARGERIEKYHARIRTKDGSIRHVQISSTGRFADGKLLHTRCFTIDVTEQHRTTKVLRARERWFRDLLEALPTAVYTTDPSGRITFFNRAAVDLAGRTPEVGKDTWCVSWKLYTPNGEFLPHSECPMAVALRERRPVRGAEAVVERPNGTRVPFLPYPTPLHDDDGNMIGAVNVLVDIGERKESETRISLLLNELNHRVKNTLATVQALAMQSLRRVPSGAMDDFVGRLLALSRVHDLLADDRQGARSISALMRAVLSPYGDQAMRLSGDPVRVPADALMPLAMLVHELATNAAKYGSLSAAAGQVAITWVRKSDHSIHLVWQESGGPAADEPSRDGFGLRLIKAIAKQQLGGSATIDFSPTGLIASFELPLRESGDDGVRS